MTLSRPPSPAAPTARSASQVEEVFARARRFLAEATNREPPDAEDIDCRRCDSAVSWEEPPDTEADRLCNHCTYEERDELAQALGDILALIDVDAVLAHLGLTPGASTTIQTAFTRAEAIALSASLANVPVLDLSALESGARKVNAALGTLPPDEPQVALRNDLAKHKADIRRLLCAEHPFDWGAFFERRGRLYALNDEVRAVVAMQEVPVRGAIESHLERRSKGES